jgi:hypothetical protein
MSHPIALMALLAYVPIAALMMMDRNSARGFTIAFLAGWLLLPEAHVIELPGIPDVSKENVGLIGAFIGTMIFHPTLFDRFRLSRSDLFLLALLQVTFITAFTNFSIKDVITDVSTLFLNFLLLIVLARIHLGTPNGLRVFLLGMIFAGVMYAPLAAWEFRMSPQFHTGVYGYFQHSFQQHFRGGFWRPIIFFSHALELGRFFAFVSFLALLPMRRDLVAMFGNVGNAIFLAPLAGLLFSQSIGPMLMFMLLSLGYLIVLRQPWVILVLPIVAWFWLLGTLFGMFPSVETIEEMGLVSEERAESLQYRLDALDEYSSIIMHRPWFGYGNWGHGRIEGRATDAQALISLLVRGFLGTIAYVGWYVVVVIGTLRVVQQTRGTWLAKRAAAIAVLGSLSLAVVVLDAAFDNHTVTLLAAMVSVTGWLQTRPQIPTLQTYVPPDQRTATT